MSFLKFLLLIFVFSQSFASTISFASTNYSELCERSAPNQLSFSNLVEQNYNNELKVITWNVHKFSNAKVFSDLKKISSDTDILLLQEAMHTPGFQDSLLQMAEFDFSFHKSFCMPFMKATGVLTASRFPLLANLTLVSPGTEPILFTHKVSGYSQVLINGRIVHVINTHALNFNAGLSFKWQVYEIGRLISKLEGPVIWAGDFNTWNSLRYRYLINLTSKLRMTHLNPSQDSRRFKLDHIFIRGLTAKQSKVLKLYTSDHFALKTTLEF